MKLVLWNVEPVYLEDALVKAYEKLYGKVFTAREAESLLLTAHIDVDTSMTNAEITEKLEALMSEVIYVNEEIHLWAQKHKARKILRKLKEDYYG